MPAALISPFLPIPGSAFFAATHFAGHANGLAAYDLFSVLEAAWLSGDDALQKSGLRLLPNFSPVAFSSSPMPGFPA